MKKWNFSKEAFIKQIPYMVMILGAFLMILTLFLPYASAVGSHKEHLLTYPNVMYLEEIGMTNRDAVNISLFDFSRMYIALDNIGMSGAIIYSIFIFVVMGFIILMTIFSALKKPKLTLVFTVLSIVSFYLVRWDFLDRGVIANSKYVFGCAEYFYIIGYILVMGGAIALIIFKKIEKRKESR